jgi:hypothetical protein
MSVEENTVFGTAIGTTIVATDDDNSDFVAKQTLTFVVANIQRRSWGGQALSDVASSYVDVESTMGGTHAATGYGQLHINEIPNYEEYNQYIVSIEVTDKDSDGTEYFTVRATITINIINVNEAPYYKTTLVQPTIEIAENSNVGTVLATSFQSMFWDPDSPRQASTDYNGSPLIYTVTGGLPNTLTLELPANDAKGQFLVSSNINFEASNLLVGNTYDLTINATDSGWDGLGNLTNIGVIKVVVLNVNEACVLINVDRQVPEHTKNNQLDSLIGYNANNPTNVGDPIVATDVDQLKDSTQTLSYSIVSGNSYASANGNISTVFAFSTSRLGQIVVNNPGVACGAGTNAEPCLKDGVTRTNDPAVKHSTSNQTTNPFQYTLGVQVIDNGSPTPLNCAATVTVIATDVNEKPYFVDPSNVATRVTSYTTSLNENNKGPSSTPVWSFAVKSQDAETPSLGSTQTLTYTMEAISDLSNDCAPQLRCTCANPGPNGKSLGCYVTFTIATTGTAGVDGIITMVENNPDALDFERLSQIYLEVTVTDSHASKQSSTALVIITVGDVNEPPVLSSTRLTLSIREDATITTQVVPLPLITEASAANDRLGADVDDPTIPAGSVKYTWTSSSGGIAASEFILNTVTQIIHVSSALNHEATASYSFQMTARDENANTCEGSSSSSICASGTQDITIVVSDVNEPPVISAINTNALNETVATGYVVATTDATDPDTNQSPTTVLTYSLLTDFNGLFAINATSGSISVEGTESLDYELVTQYVLTITVRDNGLVMPASCASGSDPACVQVPECTNGAYCLSHQMTANVIVSDVNDVAITEITNAASGAATSFDTRGGEDVVVIGTNFGTRPASSPVVAGETYHTYPTTYTPVVTATYGGRDGRTYTATGCAVTERNTKIVCKTVPGTGRKHRWRIVVDGQESPLSAAFVSYKSPTITSVVIPNPGTLPTSGQTVLTIIGDYFGPPVTDCFAQNKVACPVVWYTVKYTSPQYPSTLLTSTIAGSSELLLYTGPSTKNIRYDAVNCRVINHDELQCESVEGSGMSLEWEMSIAGQEADQIIIHGNYTKPIVARARYKKFNSCIDSKHNDGTPTVSATTVDECEISCTAASATCKAVQWNTLTQVCQHKSTSVLGDTSLSCSVDARVYSPTVATDGSDKVRLIGTNLGPAGGNMLTLSATYGPSPKGIEPYASFSPCTVIVPHLEIECPTIAGVGHSHKWNVRVGGQGSTWNEVGDAVVQTSYSIPILNNVAGPGSLEAPTKGGDDLILTGFNFGPLASTLYLNAAGVDINARYGPNQNYRYNAVNCRVTTAHTVITCSTAEGTGKDHAWVLNVGNQDSPRVEANTSYAPPMVIKYTGPGSDLANTIGNEVVTIEGRNFGPIINQANGNQPELVSYTNNLLQQANVNYEYFTASNCQVLVKHTFIQCTTSAGAGAALQWAVVVDGQSSVQPTTNYAPPKITRLYTNQTDKTKGSLSTEGGQTIFIEGIDFGPVGSDFLGDVSYGPNGLNYLATNCSVIEHSIKIQCRSVPGIGSTLHFVVNVLGQSSLASAVSLSYATPNIDSIVASNGPTSGGLRLRVTGNNYAIRDQYVQKFLSWFDG